MNKEIDWGLVPDDIEWEMTWKEEKTMEFEQDKALALLLINNIVMVGGFIRPENPPPGWAPPIRIFVICSDTFGYACADAEELPMTEIEPLYRWFIKDPMYGGIAWCILRRKLLPISPVVRSMKERGLWTAEFALLEQASPA